MHQPSSAHPPVEKPNDERRQSRENQTTHDREEQREPSAANDDIAGKSVKSKSNRQPGGSGAEDEDDANEKKPFRQISHTI